MSHEHKFRKSGMTIWCACGESRDITCAHDWTLHKFEPIEFADKTTCTMIKQNQETLICKNCGAIATVNTTAGTTKIVR